MKVLKFGGKSLASAQEFKQLIDIIQDEASKGQIAVVVSAIGDTTDVLQEILEKAGQQNGYIPVLEEFENRATHQKYDLNQEFSYLKQQLEGVSLIGEFSPKIKDRVLAQGELISSKILAAELNRMGIKAISVDSRELFVGNDHFGNAEIDESQSANQTKRYFQQLEKNIVPIVTGFIAATPQGETVTLGRNGSNYSAALLAHFLDAEELLNYTHVDGIYTANPEWVKSARKIDELHYDEAHELAHFGASILHAKTIWPLLKKKIPLRILNSFNPSNSGTLISAKPSKRGIKSLSLQNEVALIQLEGRGLLGKVGVDARIFNRLSEAGVSVGLISQGSSERGLGFVVGIEDAEIAADALKSEFRNDFKSRDVNQISIRKDIAVLSIIGQDLSNFDQAYAALIQNKIVPILFNNAIGGKNVSIVLDKKEALRALNVAHGQIFGVSKKVNLALFGHGTVGGTLINQILESAQSILEKKNIQINVFAIANSKQILLDANGIGADWESRLKTDGQSHSVQAIIDFAKEHHLENLIAVDNTASIELVGQYLKLIENGFDLVSSNKLANTQSYASYRELRKSLRDNHKEYLYETNVGAGLPLIDTIKLLHLSGENITKIRGVFSGSLSYLFNEFSKKEKSFSSILEEAIDRGYTEPDPREDLSGQDVARKLLVLARELELENEWPEIKIQNLIDSSSQQLSTTEFLNHLERLDITYSDLQQKLEPGQVWRYIGELSGDLQQSKAQLATKLEAVSTDTPLGQLKGSDSLFEIYTESYGAHPIVIQGAGAGAHVTARGVFGDILRIAAK